MTLVRWDPFRVLNALQSEMERATWTPAADVFERDDDYVIAVALPGVDPKQVRVDLDGGVLAIHGELALEGVKPEQAERRESAYGPFYRAFTLPASADSSAIRAEHKHGLLLITVPKSQAAKPKQIEVKAA